MPSPTCAACLVLGAAASRVFRGSHKQRAETPVDEHLEVIAVEPCETSESSFCYQKVLVARDSIETRVGKDVALTTSAVFCSGDSSVTRANATHQCVENILPMFCVVTLDSYGFVDLDLFALSQNGWGAPKAP